MTVRRLKSTKRILRYSAPPQLTCGRSQPTFRFDDSAAPKHIGRSAYLVDLVLSRYAFWLTGLTCFIMHRRFISRDWVLTRGRRI
ncbi:hypothetical protein OPQ81_011612 [Rhizoctonia solani]|nr:hypothetical protein OPQ81_011612 [Rhizoctonia solani]